MLALAGNGEGEQRVMHVVSVGDQSGDGLISGEQGARQARFTMVERRHRVEQMRAEADAGLDGSTTLLVGGVGVAGRNDNARASEGPECLQPARQFGGHGDQAARVGQERPNIVRGWLDHETGVVAAPPLRVQERSFEVRPQHAGAVAIRFPGLGGDRRKRGRVLQRRGDDGRQEPGDAGLRQVARDLPDGLHAGCRIMAPIAVHLQVDESRRDDGVVSTQVLDIAMLLPLSRADPGDPSVFDEDGTGSDLLLRGDDGATQE